MSGLVKVSVPQELRLKQVQTEKAVIELTEGECGCDIPVVFLRLRCSLGLYKPFEPWEREEQQDEEMTVTHLSDERSLRRSETWSQKTFDSLSLSLSLHLSYTPFTTSLKCDFLYAYVTVLLYVPYFYYSIAVI